MGVVLALKPQWGYNSASNEETYEYKGTCVNPAGSSSQQIRVEVVNVWDVSRSHLGLRDDFWLSQLLLKPETGCFRFYPATLFASFTKIK